MNTQWLERFEECKQALSRSISEYFKNGSQINDQSYASFVEMRLIYREIEEQGLEEEFAKYILQG